MRKQKTWARFYSQSISFDFLAYKMGNDDALPCWPVPLWKSSGIRIANQLLDGDHFGADRSLPPQFNVN